MSKVISDKKFFGFDWPPKMLSYSFKKRKSYFHNVTVVSLHNPDIGFVLSFTSEPKARAFKKAVGEARNAVSVEYEKKEIPVITEEKWIRQ